MQQWTIFGDEFEVTDTQVDDYLAANPFNSTEEQIGWQHWEDPEKIFR